MSSNTGTAQALRDECILFSRYLAHQVPNDYVIRKYREAHHKSEPLRRQELGRFDLLLLRFARTNRLGAKLVDAYTCLFFRSSIVRMKMVLLLAILESCSPSYTYFDSPDAGGILGFCFRMLVQGVIFVASLAIGVVLFLPVHIFFVAGALSARLVGSLMTDAGEQSQEQKGTSQVPSDLPPSR
ncbi:MAG TPA: hypothetical protein VF932_08170 [Anaerolineae bacterium]